MKLFRIEFPGKYLGGTCIIRAKNTEEAIEIFYTNYDEEIDKIFPIKDNQVIVYFDNGDY